MTGVEALLQEIQNVSNRGRGWSQAVLPAPVRERVQGGLIDVVSRGTTSHLDDLNGPGRNVAAF